jgi:hypothetical protein
VTARPRLARVLGGVLAVLALLGCGTTAPSDAPAAAQPALACIGIDSTECRFVAEKVVASVRAARAAPYAVIVLLFECEHPAPCPRTLDRQDGTATVEWIDGGEPVMVSLSGPAAEPRIERQQVAWSGRHDAGSPRAAGSGPFLFDVGHCGLTWMVDFDGSFWLPVGDIDGSAIDDPENQRGEMLLLGPDRARYAGPTGFVVNLIRFPGPKQVWLCR